MKRGFGAIAFDIINYIIMMFVIFATLYPFYYMAIVSISSGSAILKDLVKFIPVDITLKSYKLVFADPFIISAYGNTILYTTVGVCINLLLTAFCAYPISRKDFSGRRILTSIVVFTMFFNGGLIPTYIVIQKLGFINSIWAIVLPTAINVWYVMIMRTFFEAVPVSLTESAYIDGANDLVIFTKIIIPLSTPILMTLFLFYAVFHWNSFFPSMIYLNDKSKMPLQIILRNIVVAGEMASQTNSMGESGDYVAIDTTIKYAVIMVSTLPILIIYPFIQKYFVKGVMIGAVKG